MTKKRRNRNRLNLDTITQTYYNSWGKLLTPQGVLNEPVPGIGHYEAFALFGWTRQRRNSWPLIHLQVALMLEQDIKGKLVLAFPFSPVTERYVCSVVEALGWDGRVWPHEDHGWPEGTMHEEALLWLLRGVDLGATLTFPPEGEDSDSVPTLPVYIPKLKGEFFTAPLIEDPMPKHLEKLRSLVADPTPFKSDWSDTKQHQSDREWAEMNRARRLRGRSNTVRVVEP